MTFNGFQIRAIFSLAQAMVVADGQVQKEESVPMAIFSALFGLKENDLKTFLNNPMEPQDAVAIVGAMTLEQKKEVKDLLVAIMDADGERHPNEIKLLALISAICNLPS